VKPLSSRLVVFGAGTTGIVLLLVVLISFSVQTNRLRRQVDNLIAGIGTELDSQNQLTQQLESNQRQATTHLQQVRELLNLSPGRYRFPSDPDTGEESAGTEVAGRADPIRQDLLLRAIERIEREKAAEELEARLSRLIPQAFERALGGNQRLRSTGRLRWEISDENGIILRLEATPEEWWIGSITGDQEIIAVSETHDDPAIVEKVVEEALSQVDNATDQFAEYRETVRGVESFLRAIEIDDALSEAQLVAGNSTESGTVARFPILTSETGHEAFEVVVSGFPVRLIVDGEEFREIDSALAFIENRIRESDPRTAAQRATESAIERVRALVSEETFRQYLDDRRLRVRSELRESLDFFYLDLVYRDGERQGQVFGAFAIQKDIGEVYVTNAEDVVISSLARVGEDPFDSNMTAEAVGGSGGAFSGGFDGDGGLPNNFPPGFRAGEQTIDGTTILLVGTHENQADALILTHLSPDRTVSMISIPRDLWWNNRKLSHHAEIFGIEHLVEQVEAIAQRPIDGWVAVDMYAFIEVIDILGGIEVTLQEPLIDPTYRVREAGEWGTLYYEAGTHHIGGVEALRLARSRHTSNDFERAQRQQMILAALRQRMNELNAGSLDRVYELVETLNRYVTTSYSAWELAQFYLAYRNAEIANRTGLTFDNVLYNTWSNLHLQGLERSEVDQDFYLGAWILLPREDDWNVIPWFIEENIR
jgi:polyisoprenyl-teichoic acid--peptidoglycan teichoic acid transferase